MIERTYILEFRARWFSRFPWPKRRVFMSRVTTFPEVNALADELVAAGATDVAIHWDRDEQNTGKEQDS